MTSYVCGAGLGRVVVAGGEMTAVFNDGDAAAALSSVGRSSTIEIGGGEGG